MGKKYIIELEEPEMFDGRKYYQCSQMPWWSVSEYIVENLTPYVKPDLEQVRKEAYEKGFKNAWHNCPEGCAYVEQVRKEAYDKGYETAKHECEDCQKVRADAEQELADKAYQKGLSDAWEAARKIIDMPEADLLNLFTECYAAVCTSVQVFLKYDASECIEKIWQYEQRQEEQIQVGDEVIPRETEYDDMIVTRLWKDDYDSDCIDAIGFNGRIGSFLVSRVSKTGKHYEIAEVLAKMKES